MPAPLRPEDTPIWAQQAEARLGALENPQGPRLAFVTTSVGLTVANAAQYPNGWVIVSDLKTIAYSTGSHWLRIDTGAVVA